MPTLEDILSLTKDPSLDELEQGLSSGEIHPNELTDKASILLSLRRGEIKPDQINPRGLGAVFGKPYADIEKPKPVSQTITENIGRLLPQPMLEKEGVKSPFATYQGPPLPKTPGEELQSKFLAGEWRKQLQQGQLKPGTQPKGAVPTEGIEPSYFEDPLTLALYSGFGNVALLPRLGIRAIQGATAPYATYLAEKARGANPPLPTVQEVGGSAVFAPLMELGFAGIGKALQWLGAKTGKSPGQIMQEVAAESKATNVSVPDIIRKKIDDLGTPTEAEVMAGQAIAPEMKPYSPALTGAYAKQGKIPEVKPAEIAPAIIPKDIKEYMYHVSYTPNLEQSGLNPEFGKGRAKLFFTKGEPYAKGYTYAIDPEKLPEGFFKQRPDKPYEYFATGKVPPEAIIPLGQTKPGEPPKITERLQNYFKQQEPIKPAEITPTETFIHEGRQPITQFDLSKIGTGQGESWYGQGAYLTKKGGFKFETYGPVKSEFALPKDAKIFSGDIVSYAENKGLIDYLLEKRASQGLGKDNITPKDVFDSNWIATEKGFRNQVVDALQQEGYKGYRNGDELVMYDPTVLKPTQPTEPKSFRVTPEEVKPTGEITPYREGMEEVKPPEAPPVEAKPTEPTPVDVSEMPWWMQASRTTKADYIKNKYAKYPTTIPEQIAKSAPLEHEIAVGTALDQGLYVPPEVLKDYPNLAKRYQVGKAPTEPIPPTQPEIRAGAKPTLAIRDAQTGKIYTANQYERIHADMLARVQREGTPYENIEAGWVMPNGEFVTNWVGKKTAEGTFPPPRYPEGPPQEISAGVKEAPTEVAQYHDLQGRPITKGGELLEPSKPPTQVEAQAQMENRITDIDTQVEQLQKKLDLAYGAEMEAGAKRGYAEGMKGRRGGAYKGQATILTKKYGKPEDIQTQITTLQNEKADILKQVGIEPPPLQPEAPSVQGVKQPWEMTRKEYAESQLKEMGFKETERTKSMKTSRALRKGDLQYNHFKTVEQALSEGKPVPPEVLKDYPDLKPSTVQPEAPSVPTIMESTKYEPKIKKETGTRSYNRLMKKADKYFAPGEHEGVESPQWREMTARAEAGASAKETRLKLINEYQFHNPETGLKEWKPNTPDYVKKHYNDMINEQSQLKEPEEVLKDYPDLKPSIAKRLITEEKGAFEPYRPTPPDEENVFEPRVKEEIVATLAKTATPILKGQAGGDKRRLFQQIADLIDNHEIMTQDIKPMLDKLNITPEQFASDWRETISGSGRDLYQLSRVAKELNKTFRNNPEAQKIMEDIAKQGPDNWWAISKDYWNKMSRVWRASLISQLATGMRNIGSQVIRGGVDTVDYALQGLAKGDVKEVPYRIFDDMNALFHSFKKGPQRDFFMKALDAYPIERARMLSTSIHEVGALNKYTQALGILYRGPELLQRKMAGQVQLARELSAIGKDFHTATIEDLTQPMMERVAQKTLELTFAETPKSGFTQSLMKVWKEVPMFQLINPFPRFLFGNALKFLYEFSPLGATRLLSNGAKRAIAGGNKQILSRATIGTGLVAMGMALRASQFAGPKWYQLKIGDHTYDTRPYAPFSTYLLIGESIVNPDNLHISDGALALIGLNRLAGTGLVFLDWLQEGTTGETAIKQLKKFGGQFASGFTVPFRTVKDIIAGISPEENIIRSTKEDLLTGPARANIPGLSQTLPPQYSPYQPGEITTEHPAMRQFTGLSPRVIGPLETEVNRLKLDYRQIYPSTGIPEADRIITKNMGEFIAQSPFPLDDPSYTESPEPMKRLMMREYMKQMRQAAKMQLYSDNPDLYQKVYEKGMDPDMMELMQEQQQAGGE